MTLPKPAVDLRDDERRRWQSFYDDRARPCPFFVGVPDESLVQWLQEGLIAPGRALDIGCGNARNAIFLARHGFDVDAVDYSASAIAWAKDEIAAAHVAVRLTCASALDLEVAAASYDLVVDSGCFHHVAPLDRRRYVDAVARALRPAGHLALACFAPEGGSGYSDAQVHERGSLGGGLGYDEARLREVWGERFDFVVLRRMRDEPPQSDVFGRSFLWAALARRR
jgi:SAM-dependent methyltransferase